MFCSECGTKVDQNMKFCPNCGKEINNNTNTIKQENINSNNNIFKGIIIGVLVLIISVLAFTFINLPTNETPGSSLVENGNNSRTIMIYMVGSNLEYQSGIASADIASIDPAKIDLDNNHIYLYTGGTKEWFNFVSNEENAIYKLEKDGFKKVESYKKLNMGDPDTLKDLLKYGYENSKTDRYDLIIYDHGGATDGAIYDDFTNDNLSLKDFSEALKASPFNANNKLETILFRTCLNGTLEVANVFKNYAYYMVASEEVTNGASSSSVLNFLNDVSETDTAIDYGKKYINAYDEQMKNIDPFQFSSDPMYSIIDLTKLSKLNIEFDKFISKVDLKNNYNDIVRLRSNLFQFAKSYYGINDYDTVDLYSLVEGLKPYASESTDEFNKAFNETVIYNWTSVDATHGLSVYFPYSAQSNTQTALMSVYDNLSFSNNYKNFISDFKKTHLSGNVSAFNKEIVNNNSSVTKKKEFSLELTDKQVNDYADSIYIIFKKQKDGKYTAVYSSNNTIQDGKYLKTNIANNLIRIKLDMEDRDEDYFYIPLVERTKDKKKTISFGAIVANFKDSFETVPVNMYVDFDKKGKPYIANAVVSEKNGVSGGIVDIKKYTTYEVLSSHYDILDKNGNYTPKWDNNGVIMGYDFKPEEFKLEKASLDDSDYYCVFRIKDIYGNDYYSKLLNME